MAAMTGTPACHPGRPRIEECDETRQRHVRVAAGDRLEKNATTGHDGAAGNRQRAVDGGISEGQPGTDKQLELMRGFEGTRSLSLAPNNHG
jgi:hypothetical protein